MVVGVQIWLIGYEFNLCTHNQTWISSHGTRNPLSQPQDATPNKAKEDMKLRRKGKTAGPGGMSNRREG